MDPWFNPQVEAQAPPCAPFRPFTSFTERFSTRKHIVVGVIGDADAAPASVTSFESLWSTTSVTAGTSSRMVSPVPVSTVRPAGRGGIAAPLPPVCDRGLISEPPATGFRPVDSALNDYGGVGGHRARSSVGWSSATSDRSDPCELPIAPTVRTYYIKTNDIFGKLTWIEAFPVSPNGLSIVARETSISCKEPTAQAT